MAHAPLKHRIPLFVLLAALLGTAIASWQTARAAASRAGTTFDRATMEITHSLQGKLDVYQTLVRSVAALFVASDHVEPREFAHFIDRLQIDQTVGGDRAAARKVRDRQIAKPLPVRSGQRRQRQHRAERHDPGGSHDSGVPYGPAGGQSRTGRRIILRCRTARPTA